MLPSPPDPGPADGVPRDWPSPDRALKIQLALRPHRLTGLDDG